MKNSFHALKELSDLIQNYDLSTGKVMIKKKINYKFYQEILIILNVLLIKMKDN